MARSDNSPTRVTKTLAGSDRAHNASSNQPGKPAVLIRRARLEDEPHIREFTRNTFEWGDYVADAFPEWLENGYDVYVAEVDGIPVGVTCVAYYAEDEAWFQGIRVKQEMRRMGIASKLTEASIAAARERGVRLCRAHIDADNYKSQGLATTMGFHKAATIAEFTVRVAGNVSAVPDGSAHEAIEVTTITHEEAGDLFEAASKEVHYIGCEYVWLTFNRKNFIQAATENVLFVARDESGRTLAGGLMSNLYVEDHIHTGPAEEESGERQHTGNEEAYLCAALGSLFGTAEGMVAIIRHALKLLHAEAAKRSITPGELFVAIESANPAAGEILGYSRQAGLDMQVHGETGLWELKFSE